MPTRAGEGNATGAGGRRTWSAGALLRELWPRLLRSVAAAAATCLPVGVVALLVRTKWEPLLAWDRSIIAGTTDLARDQPGFREALIVWQEIFQPWHVYLAATPIAAWVWFRGLRGRAVWGFVTMMVGWNLGLDVKLLMQRARPLVEDPVSTAPGFSFPSGHAFNTAMATTTCLVMAWPLLRERGRPAQVAVLAFGVAIVVLTALDRVYLGVHFPSDVTAGVLLALGLVGASWLGFRHRPKRPGQPRTDGPPPEST